MPNRRCPKTEVNIEFNFFTHAFNWVVKKVQTVKATKGGTGIAADGAVNVERSRPRRYFNSPQRAVAVVVTFALLTLGAVVTSPHWIGQLPQAQIGSIRIFQNRPTLGCDDLTRQFPIAKVLAAQGVDVGHCPVDANGAHLPTDKNGVFTLETTNGQLSAKGQFSAFVPSAATMAAYAVCTDTGAGPLVSATRSDPLAVCAPAPSSTAVVSTPTARPTLTPSPRPAPLQPAWIQVKVTKPHDGQHMLSVEVAETQNAENYVFSSTRQQPDVPYVDVSTTHTIGPFLDSERNARLRLGFE